MALAIPLSPSLSLSATAGLIKKFCLGTIIRLWFLWRRPAALKSMKAPKTKALVFLTKLLERAAVSQLRSGLFTKPKLTAQRVFKSAIFLILVLKFTAMARNGFRAAATCPGIQRAFITAKAKIILNTFLAANLAAKTNPGWESICAGQTKIPIFIHPIFLLLIRARNLLTVKSGPAA